MYKHNKKPDKEIHKRIASFKARADGGGGHGGGQHRAAGRQKGRGRGSSKRIQKSTSTAKSMSGVGPSQTTYSGPKDRTGRASKGGGSHSSWVHVGRDVGPSMDGKHGSEWNGTGPAGDPENHQYCHPLLPSYSHPRIQSITLLGSCFLGPGEEGNPHPLIQCTLRLPAEGRPSRAWPTRASLIWGASTCPLLP